MPRGPRVILDNSIFHIINRGNGRQEVFHNKEDFKTFLSIVAFYKDKWGFKLYHFCLMPNHFHLLGEVGDAKLISKAMHDITASYTRSHHSKHRTVGYLWQGRFKNMIIEKDNYLLACGAYIERNPKRAGLVENSEDWPWSSYQVYVSGIPIVIPITNIKGEKKLIKLLDENPFYKEFGDTEKERQEVYRNLSLELGKNEADKKFGFRENKILGSQEFKIGLQKEGIRIEPAKRGRPLGNNKE
ncbi:transposase [Patescibacteria group bacterium]|nr:transposase [Patescibacteria group bacterium]MBU4162224.1 transposase [Patescibacteria group bacterium]